jgi:hypothetical protein
MGTPRQVGGGVFIGKTHIHLASLSYTFRENGLPRDLKLFDQVKPALVDAIEQRVMSRQRHAGQVQRPQAGSCCKDEMHRVWLEEGVADVCARARRDVDRMRRDVIVAASVQQAIAEAGGDAAGGFEVDLRRSPEIAVRCSSGGVSGRGLCGFDAPLTGERGRMLLSRLLARGLTMRIGEEPQRGQQNEQIERQ